MQYLRPGLYSVNAPLDLYIVYRGKAPQLSYSEVKERRKLKSLREIAAEYGVSHETVRRTANRAPDF